MHDGSNKYVGLSYVDAENDIYLLAIVELTDGLGVAFLTLVLGVKLKIHIRRKLGETIIAVRANDVSFHRVGPRIRQINDRVDHGIIRAVQNSAGQHTPAAGFIFVLGAVR